MFELSPLLGASTENIFLFNFTETQLQENNCDADDLKITSLAYVHDEDTISCFKFERTSQSPKPNLKMPNDYGEAE